MNLTFESIRKIRFLRNIPLVYWNCGIYVYLCTDKSKHIKRPSAVDLIIFSLICLSRVLCVLSVA
jgi:hypothetical protein